MINILYAVIFGAIAGLFSWFIIQLPFIKEASPILGPILNGIILGLIVGGFLGIVKGVVNREQKKILSGLLDGLILGITGGVASQLIIAGLASGPEQNLLFHLSGWGIFGLFLGVGQRLDKPSTKGILYGAIGGIAGGVIGGFVLESFSRISIESGWWAQAIGMAALGILLGASINSILLLIGREEKKAVAPPAPAPAPVRAPAPAPTPTAAPRRTPTAAPKPEIMAEPVKPAPAPPLKKWLEANFAIEKPQISIGSGFDNDIIIRAPGIEAKQALIYQEKGRFLIRNTGTSKEIFVSFTGDLIQGRKLAINDFNALKEGSAIRLNQESLMFFHTAPPSLAVRYPMDKARIIIGAAPENDIVIKDPNASARHAQISWEKERGMVLDLGSISGTYVSYSGNRAEERRIQDKNAVTNNSLIRIGNVTFRVLG